MANSPKKVCIVTIHGIGFQQPPHDGQPGYADGLHANLAAELKDRLGHDPDRGHGPVYVMSAKPGTRDTEWGLSRLGTFPKGGGDIDISDAPLTAGDEPIAHVAVVYVPLEGISPGLLSGVATIGDAGLRLHRYASVGGAIRLAVGDVVASLRAHSGKKSKPAKNAAKTAKNVAETVAAPGDEGPGAEPVPWLFPRDDVRHGPRRRRKPRRQSAEPHLRPDQLGQRPAAGLAGVFETLENDVVGYVDRNDLREPIRSFVAEVLHRLTKRPDVERIVVNSHSQGTVVAFDVLRSYPAAPKSPVATLVTAGSPLRKYADMFSWGQDVGGIQSMKWLNFWDAKDPVADPLDPPPSWRFGDPPVREPGELGLLWATDGEGKQIQIPIRDGEVDNLTHSYGSGLRAHNYWNNRAQFIPALVKVVDE